MPLLMLSFSLFFVGHEFGGGGGGGGIEINLQSQIEHKKSKLNYAQFRYQRK